MKLYKYTPHMTDFIKNCSLKFTPSSQLNDPFELRLTQEFIKNAVQEARERSLPKSIINPCESALEQAGNHDGVLSLTKNWDSLTMWGYYTNNFSGGVIELEIDDDISEEKTKQLFCNFEIKKIGNVTYSETRPKFKKIEEIKSELIEFFFTKPEDWKHENEFRIIGDFTKANFFKVSESTFKLLEKYYRDYPFDIKNKENDNVIFSIRQPQSECNLSLNGIFELLCQQNSFHPLVQINPLKVKTLYFGMNFKEKITPKDLEKFENIKTFTVIPDNNIYKFNLEQFDFAK